MPPLPSSSTPLSVTSTPSSRLFQRISLLCSRRLLLCPDVNITIRKCAATDRFFVFAFVLAFFPLPLEHFRSRVGLVSPRREAFLQSFRVCVETRIAPVRSILSVRLTGASLINRSWRPRASHAIGVAIVRPQLFLPSFFAQLVPTEARETGENRARGERKEGGGDSRRSELEREVRALSVANCSNH